MVETVALEEQRKPRRRRRWLFWLSSLLLIVAGFVGWLRWKSPPVYRITAVVPIIEERGRSVFMYSGTSGIAYLTELPSVNRTPQTSLCIRGWDGKVRATISPAAGTDLNRMLRLRRNVVVSPDIHYAAIAVVEKTQLMITTWHDGQQVGTAYLPWNISPKTDIADSEMRITVTNSGRVLLAFPTPATLHLAAIDGSRVMATGQYASRLTKAGRGHSCRVDFAPDGRYMLVSHYEISGKDEYVSLSIGNGKMTPAYRYTASTPEGMYPMLFDGGALMNNDATVYGPSGANTRINTMNKLNGVVTIDDKPTSTHVALFEQSIVTPYMRYTRCRILNPATGDNWSFNCLGDPSSVRVSSGGQYAYAISRQMPSTRMEGLANRLRRLRVFRGMADRMDDAKTVGLLYERSGQLLARLPLNDSKMRFSNQTFHLDMSDEHWNFSPDGNLLVRVQEGEKGYFLVLKWR